MRAVYGLLTDARHHESQNQFTVFKDIKTKIFNKSDNTFFTERSTRVKVINTTFEVFKDMHSKK